LQVRDFPQETYLELVQVAKEQNRTVPQQVIFFLSSILNANKDSVADRRHKVLVGLDALELHLPVEAPSPAELVRQDRDGLSIGGRFR
ncbi:MAG: hypothetical protein IKT97_01160, partial [Spirochaetia bacterium]|nr:hypothetical protein [Spirochaetia bacterium]